MHLTKNTLVSVSLATLTMLTAPLLAWGGDAAADAERVKQQALAIPNLQQAAAASASYQNPSIEVKSAAHQITITVINSKLNDGAKTDRNAEATKIADAVAKAIAGRPEFAQVVMIHVDYVKRVENSTSVIQGVDFNKAADGAFQLHQT